jgi:hypothetical protein
MHQGLEQAATLVAEPLDRLNVVKEGSGWNDNGIAESLVLSDFSDKRCPKNLKIIYNF